MAILDISNPSSPTRVARITTGVCTHDGGGFVRVVGSLAYVTGGLGLAVFDMCDPVEPKQLGSVVDTGVLACSSAGHVFVDGDLAYVVGGLGMRIYSVAEPSEPTPLGPAFSTTVATHDGGGFVCVRDGVAYTTGGRGLAIFDVTEATAPRRLATIDTGVLTYEDSGCVALVKSHAFIIGTMGVQCVDVSDPTAPELVGAPIETGVIAANSAVHAAYDERREMLFVSGGLGMAVLDVSNPASVGRDPNGAVQTIARRESGFITLGLDGTHVFSCGGAGLSVFEIVEEADEKPKKRRNTGWK